MPFLDKTKMYTGNKAKLGKTFFVQNPNGRNAIGIFASYCPDCNYKILLTHQEMRLLTKCYKASSKSFRERLINYLLKKLEMPKAEYVQNRRAERHAEYLLTQY